MKRQRFEPTPRMQEILPAVFGELKPTGNWLPMFKRFGRRLQASAPCLGLMSKRTEAIGGTSVPTIWLPGTPTVNFPNR